MVSVILKKILCNIHPVVVHQINQLSFVKFISLSYIILITYFCKIYPVSVYYIKIDIRATVNLKNLILSINNTRCLHTDILKHLNKYVAYPDNNRFWRVWRQHLRKL